MTVFEKQQKRQGLVAKGNAIRDKAVAEKRDLTAAEVREFDSIAAEVDRLANEILTDEKRSGFRPPLNSGFDQRSAADDGGPLGNIETRALLDGESCATYLRHRGVDLSEAPRVGIGEYLRAMVMGSRNEDERRALSEGTDSAGGYTVPTKLQATLIDRLRAAAVVTRAGARTVVLDTLKTSLARIASDPTPVWRAEAAAVSESDATFDRVEFQPKSLAVLIKVSREVLDDSVNINDAITTVLTSAMALELDRVALFGTGASNQPKGVYNFTSAQVLSMGTNGDQVEGYGTLLDAGLLLAEANAGEATAAIMAPRTRTAMAKLVDGEGRYLQRPKELENLPFLSTTQVPTNLTQGTANNASPIIMGDFSQLVIGMRTDLRIEVLKERYADTMQYGFIAWMRADVQAQHQESFVNIKGIIP